VPAVERQHAGVAGLDLRIEFGAECGVYIGHDGARSRSVGGA
jgi:hypothetical protein